MDRREILKGSVAAAATLALPASLPAQARSGNARDAALVEIAKKQQQRAGDVLWHRDYVGIVDFGLRSSEPRFHFVNLERGVVDSYLVSHGDGSDPDHDGWLNWFSNQPDSHCSSKGLYMTYGWYTGRFGTSIRLEGLDPTNSNALDRAIVMHRAKYAERAHLERWGRLGRSNGCFAMGNDDFKQALLQIGGGRVLFADKLGLAPDGSKVAGPNQGPSELPNQPGQTLNPAQNTAPSQPSDNARLLTPDPPRGKDILNPGVF